MRNVQHFIWLREQIKFYLLRLNQKSAHIKYFSKNVKKHVVTLTIVLANIKTKKYEYNITPSSSAHLDFYRQWKLIFLI